jgi:antitoxin HicB
VDVREQVAGLKQRRRSVSPKEIHALLTSAGFERRYGKGDHWVYTHHDRRSPLTIDPRKPLLPAYVSKATTAEDYLTLPYRIILTPDTDDEGRSGWVAEVPQLAGCISQGDTPDDAVERVKDAMAGWISVALEDGRGIPKPDEDDDYSGRFVVRLPTTLHAELARQAEAEGVSLNQFVSGVLAAATGWRSRGPQLAGATASVLPNPRRAPRNGP